MEEKTLPKLCVSREEANKKIQKRIDKGQQLHDRQIDSRDEYSLALNGHGNWSRQNKNLLLHLFDGSLVAEEYARYCIFYPMGIVSSPNTEERVEFSRDVIRYRENVDRDINYLMEIQDQLELYGEPSDNHSSISGSIGTNVFIGHGRSQDWRELKDFISDKLKLPWDEFNRVPVAGVTNIARLAEMLGQACMAFLVMTAEDEQTDGTLHARENVIHEAGLFQGKLGFEKAIILLEEGCQEFSNIHGLGQIRFPKGNIKAAFENIREVLEREGILS